MFVMRLRGKQSMKKPSIVMLIGFLPNHRLIRRLNVEKEIAKVDLICWDRGADMLPPPCEDGFNVHIIKIQAGNDPIKRIIPTRKFASQAKKILKDIKPQVIHVQGLDMLQIAVSYKKHNDNSVKIIYEVADLHRYIVDEQKDMLHKSIKQYLIHEDKVLEKYYELLVLTSEAYYDSYFSAFVPESKYLYMPNMPNLRIYDSYNKKNGGEFTIGYIGGVRYKKQIYNLIEAAKINNIKLLIAGYEEAPIELEPICQSDPDIEWVGKFEYSDAPLLYSKCDAMYSVYDADMANVRVALPNKLYESIYCEMPIIVAKNTFLADTVKKWDVGIAVDHKDSNDLANQIPILQNQDEYERIVHNCHELKEKWKNLNPNDEFKNRLIKLMTEAQQ